MQTEPPISNDPLVSKDDPVMVNKVDPAVTPELGVTAVRVGALKLNDEEEVEF